MRIHSPAKAQVIYNTGIFTQKDKLEHYNSQYCPIRSELVMINGITMKGKRIIIPFLSQKQILQQLHSNYMGMEKMRLLAFELKYLGNMNADIKNTVKQCATCMEYQQTQQHEKSLPCEMSYKLWEVVCADMFCYM